MKNIHLLLCCSLALASVSCSDKDKIAAAYNGDKELGEGSPVPFLLYQNYPNPFNPATSIRFAVSRPMSLKLTVFAEDWQEVRVLFDQQITLGTSPPEPPIAYYEIVFDAINLPSGDYYYVLEGMGYKQIRKMRLLK